MRDLVFVGIKGTVLALDRALGTEIWRTKLKGGDLVSLMVNGDSVYATARGEIFSLDAATGTIRWNNSLPGMGWGLSCIASATGSAGLQPVLNAKRRKEQAAAAAAAGGGV